tara:strand:- start:228 stop:1331 length:1104 start_codon:yes stop_codon:yes gene_type:complete
MALTQVNTDGVKDDAVTQAKVANDAIDLTEIKAGVDGKIISYDASGNPVAIGPGTDGQVLTSAGAGAEPAFEDAVSEGTQVKSTGESGGTKFLREDGDGTSSWQTVSAGTALTGSTNNQICTVTGANAIAGEANLTFDGTNLDLPTVNTWIKGGGHSVVQVDATMSYFYGGSGGAQFRKADNSAPLIEVSDTGNLEITDGDLVIGTSGHGIDFSATTDANNGTYGGTKSDELLHDYEYGTWTPTLLFGGGTTGQSYTTQAGRYTKVGNLVTVQCQLNVQSKGSSTGNITMSGLPWLSKDYPAMLVILGDGIAYSGNSNFCQLSPSNANHYWAVQQGGDGNSGNFVYLTHAAINNGNYYLSGSYVAAD